MAEEKDDIIREITVPTEEIQYGRNSRYMELESQEIHASLRVETPEDSVHQQHVSTAHQTSLSKIISDVPEAQFHDSQLEAQEFETMGTSPALGQVGTISSSQTTDMTSTVKMRTKATTVSVDTSTGDRLTQPTDTDHDRKRDSTHILEKFEEQAKSFQEQMLLLPSKPKKPRAPSPGIFRQSVGLDHLDNLVRLMEQLTQLRDENSRLKKRCEYLENTKSLLQVRTLMGGQEIPLEGPPPPPAGYLTLPTTSKSKPRRISEELEIEPQRPRLASAEDSQYLEIEEELFAEKRSSVDQEQLKRSHKRSYSTGSIDVPDGVMSEDPLSSTNGSKLIEPLVELSKTGSKHKKMSKWAKVKKVFSGHKPAEEAGAVGGPEVDKAVLISVPDMTTSQEGGDKHYLTTPHVGLSESRSVDSGVGSGLEGADMLRMSSSSGEPSSPSRKMVHSRSGSSPHEVSGETGIESWVGAPEWEEPQRQGSYASGLSEEGSSAEGKSSRAHSAKEGKEKSLYLQVETKYPYVRRSSSLEGLEELQKNSELVTRDSGLHRSASTKSDGKSPSPDVEGHQSSKEKKLHRSAWGRVKDIIHTRKDSLKKRTKKGEKSDSDISEGLDYSEFLADIGDASEERPSPKSSTKSRNSGERRSLDASSKKSPRLKSSGSSGSPPSQGQLFPSQHGGPGFDITQLMGAMTDEYMKKMQDWEEKKNRKSIASRGSVSPAKGKDAKSKEGTPDGAMTPTETPWQSVNVEDVQRNLTESFNRKLQEWEKMKYRRDPSPMMERKGTTQVKKKEERKHKKSKSDKEKEKFDRLREREIHRVEKEVQKLEREKIRLEKERLKALEKEAKIEKMKGRLSQADIETKLKNPILGPLSEYKVTAEFARKLHEWEVRKGMSQEASTSLYLEIQKRSLELADEMYHGEAHYQPRHSIGRAQRRREQRSELEELSPPVSPTEKESPQFSLGEEAPHGEGELERQLSDESTGPPADGESSSSVTEERLTSINIPSLEKANVSLMEELRKKESEYMKAQLEVHNLNEKLQTMKNSHTEALVTYRREMETLQQGEQPLPQVSLTDLEGKIQELETFGDKVVLSMESAAICKFQSIEGEEAVGVQLMELVDQMKSMLTKVSHTEEASKRSSMMHDFEKLYSHAMQLQVQMNNLRLSHLERNKEIMDLKRQLLLQEVTNLLLQVDITRRETELTHYKESKQRSLHRSSTYSDMEESDDRLQVEPDVRTSKPPLKRFVSVGDPVQCEQLEVEGERSPKSPIDTDVSREHTLDVFFPLEGRDRSSTTSADSTEMSSAKSGDTGSMSDDPFIASLPTTDSLEMLPPDQRISPASTSTPSPKPSEEPLNSQPVIKLLPVPPAKIKSRTVSQVEQYRTDSQGPSVTPESRAVSQVEKYISDSQDPSVTPESRTVSQGEKYISDSQDPSVTPESRTVSQGEKYISDSQDPSVTPESRTVSQVEQYRTESRTVSQVEKYIPDSQDPSVTPESRTVSQVEQYRTESRTVSQVEKYIPDSQDPSVTPESRTVCQVEKYIPDSQDPSRIPDSSLSERTLLLDLPSDTLQFPSTTPDTLQFPSAPPDTLQFPSSPPDTLQFPSTPPDTLQFPSSPSTSIHKGSESDKLDLGCSFQDKTLFVEIPSETIEYPEPVDRDSAPLIAQQTLEGDTHKTIVLTQPAKLRQDSTSRMLAQSARLKRESHIAAPESSTSSLSTPSHIIYSSSQLHSKIPRGEKLSEWLKREPKLPTLVIPEFKRGMEKPRLERSPAIGGDSKPEEFITGLPPSPVIRSRQTRKLRADEKIGQQKPSASELARIPATPPRSNRHRMAKQDQALESPQNGRRSMYVTSDPNFTSHSKELIKQTQDLETRSAPDSLPKKSRSPSNLQSKKPVSDMISQFEKQSSLDEPPHLVIRKSPSPTIVPYIGLVSPVGKLKPASELLQESQTKGRLLSPRGHIHRLEAMTQRTQSEENTSSTRSNNKENETNYVKAIVHRMSRETTPERKILSKDHSPQSGPTTSALVHRSDSPRSNSEFVQQIVRKLSTSVETEQGRCVAPLKDLTNDGQVKTLTEAFSGGSSPTSPSRSRARFIHEPRSASSSRSPPVTRALYTPTTSPSVLRRVYERSSKESLSPTSPRSPRTARGRFVGLSQPVPYKPDSSISVMSSLPSSTYVPTTHSSVTSSLGLASEHSVALASVIPEEQIHTEDSAHLVPQQDSTKQTSYEIQVLERSIKYPEEEERTTKSPTSPRVKRSLFSKKSSAQKLPPSGKSSEKTGKKQATIGTLCQQAMTFDLGISGLNLSKDQDHDRVDFRKSDPVKLPSSCTHSPPPKSPSAHSDEGNLSPQPSEEKTKTKAKFLDYSWLQRSKKLFKVSNTASSEPDDCGCQACHGRPGDSTCSLCCR